MSDMQQQKQTGGGVKLNSKTLILIGIALFALIAIAGITTYERAHDPDWWKHVGIRHERSNNNNTSSGSNNVILLDDGNMFVVPQHNNGQHQHQHQQQQHPADQHIRPLNGRGPESRRLVSLDLKSGVDYEADYDLSNLGQPKWPEGKKKKFDFIDVTSANSTWVGKWVSHSPYVAVVPEFLTDEECDQLIVEANKQLFRSQVAPYKNSNENPVNEVRTSSQAWLNPTYGVAKTVVDRVMKMMAHAFPPDAHEELQILRYKPGERYLAHDDSFNPVLYGPQATNRAVTVFLYLADVEAGGETVFPRAGGRPPPMEFKSCDKGLRVKPRKRTLALFYDMTPDLELDHTALHGGCPVKKGTKWGGTLWLRKETPH